MIHADATGKSKDGVVGYGWNVAETATSPGLTLGIQPLPQGETPSLEDYAASLVTRVGKTFKNYQHTPIEYGDTGYGRTARFYGRGEREGSVGQFAVYAFLTPTSEDYFVAAGADDAGAQWLPTFESAILTGSVPGAIHSAPPPADGAPQPNDQPAQLPQNTPAVPLPTAQTDASQQNAAPGQPAPQPPAPVQAPDGMAGHYMPPAPDDAQPPADPNAGNGSPAP
jgi:hypothetical protein